MKKLSEYKDEEALELLADLIDPVTEIIIDKEVVKEFKKNKLRGISKAIKKHKSAVFRCLAVLDGTPDKEYHCNIVTLPKTILEIINDKDLIDFFNSQSQETDEGSSGSATENGEAEG